MFNSSTVVSTQVQGFEVWKLVFGEQNDNFRDSGPAQKQANQFANGPLRVTAMAYLVRVLKNVNYLFNGIFIVGHA